MQIQDIGANHRKPLLVSVVDALAITGIGRTKFYELIKSGRVRAIKVGAKTLVQYESLEALAREGA